LYSLLTGRGSRGRRRRRRGREGGREGGSEGGRRGEGRGGGGWESGHGASVGNLGPDVDSQTLLNAFASSGAVSAKVCPQDTLPSLPL